MYEDELIRQTLSIIKKHDASDLVTRLVNTNNQKDFQLTALTHVKATNRT